MRRKFRQYYALSFAYQMGFSMIAPLIMFIGGGIWLDKRFSTTPVFTLLGVVLGLVISALSIYNQLGPLLEKNRKKSDRSPRNSAS